MDLKKRVALKAAEKLAGSIDKETFLSQLKTQWKDLIETGKIRVSSLDQMVEEADSRIKASGFEQVFKKVGVTRDDIRIILGEILEE